MARSLRTARKLADLLKALDDHQYLLRNALHGLKEDRAHIKSLATELRALVCKSSGTEGLLWRVADELEVSDEIELEVAESVVRDHELARSLMAWQLPFHRGNSGRPGRLSEIHRLRDVFKTCEAIYVAQIPDVIYTHELLIGAIAGQMGSAHEAEGLDYALVRLNQLAINQTELYVKVLEFDAELTLQIGERVLDHAEKRTGYSRTLRSSENGDVTFCVRLSLGQHLAARLPLVTLKSEISESDITCAAGPLSVVFTLTRRGVLVSELLAPHPADWDLGTDALFSMSYSSRHRKVRTLTNDKTNGAPAPCDFGCLDARELNLEPCLGYEEFVNVRCVPVYARLLASTECGDLLRISADGREILAGVPESGAFPP